MNHKKMLLLVISLLLVSLFLAACGSASTPAPTAVPTNIPASTSTPVPSAPVEVVQNFYKAWNDNNLDAAMALVADDFQCSGGGCRDSSDKEAFRGLIQGMMKSDAHELGNVVVAGDTVTFSITLRNRITGKLEGIVANGWSMKIRDGKIIYMFMNG
jgi:ketosteroid isomerase-like protein